MAKKILIFTLILMISNNVFADCIDKTSKFVNKLTDSVIEIASDDKMKEEEKYALLTKLFIKSVDLNWMARFAIGKHWYSLDDQMKKDYINTYRRFIISIYVPKFQHYSEQIYKIKDIKVIQKQQYMVFMDIVPSNNSDPIIQMDYRIKHFDDDKFMIRDIIAEKVSLIAAQRSDFNSFINKKGIDELITALRKKII